MNTPTTPPPQQGQDDGQHGHDEHQQGGQDRPTLEELRQQSVALSEQIAQHLGRGAK
ncbi:hypothetical protein SBI_05576 [Streptomyces bingchenggensis BCW-1]|uniref:Uncharacterized protein n=1 Tax=Streptomyces bingchenggensis (strain BCW-1) TaxID=749414 RepID=D7CAX9_STRBB|nr:MULTISPECIES: hypothetical protein [Streptomyces]ADI08696.1 hypothetical protein SBI_05576 [Streptomyces bingchenggensis BCW-1]